MSNSESHPLFVVGEEVILQAVNCHEYNGNHTIGNVLYCENKTLEDDSVYTGFYYSLEGVPFTWVEYVLKKKYPTADFTFDELMNELKLNKELENED